MIPRGTLDAVLYATFGLWFSGEGFKAMSLVFGTGLGGLLAQPTVHFPETFAASGLFGRWESRYASLFASQPGTFWARLS